MFSRDMDFAFVTTLVIAVILVAVFVQVYAVVLDLMALITVLIFAIGDDRLFSVPIFKRNRAFGSVGTDACDFLVAHVKIGRDRLYA